MSNFGKIRAILSIARYFNLSFGDISVQECDNIQTFKEICEESLGEWAEYKILTDEKYLDPNEKEILREHYYKQFFNVHYYNDYQYPNLIWLKDYNICLDIPEDSKSISREFTYSLLSCCYFAQIYKLKTCII